MYIQLDYNNGGGWHPGPEHCGCSKDKPMQRGHLLDADTNDEARRNAVTQNSEGEQMPPWRRHKSQRQVNTNGGGCEHECTLQCMHIDIIANNHDWLKSSALAGSSNCTGPPSSGGSRVDCSSNTHRQSSQSHGCASCANCMSSVGLSADLVPCLCPHEWASYGDDGRGVMSPAQGSPATKL